jgi:hypothetical protein
VALPRAAGSTDWLPPVARDDLIGLPHGAHALVVPSQWDENHPMVLQYAMAVGVPVLCSAVASLAHLAAQPGVHLVEGYHDAAAWVRAVDDLASRPPRPATDPTAPVRRDYEEFVDTTVDVYRKAVDRRRGPSAPAIGLLDIFDCSMDDLIEPVAAAGVGTRAKKAVGGTDPAGLGGLRPKRARITG